MQTMESVNTVEKPAFLRDTRDRVMVALSAALGVLFCELVLFEGFGIGMTAWLAMLYGAALWYLRGSAPRSPLGWVLLAPIAALGLCFTLYDNEVLKLLNFLVVFCLCALQLAQWSNLRAQRFTAAGLTTDLFHTAVVLPLANLPSPFRVLGRDAQEQKRSRGISQVLLGVLIALPLLIVVLSLLSRADAVFERLLGDSLRYFNEHLSESAAKLIIGLMLALPLGGLLYALRRRRAVAGFNKPIAFEKAAFLDSRVSVTVLSLLSAVYAAFIIVQFGYLFNGFRSLLPQSFTYAEYARRGFFELMGVVAVNLCVFGVALALTRKPLARSVRAMLLTLGACTLALIASALAKMALYINAYGLSELRVYTSWFMALCAVVFVVLMLHVLFRNIKPMPILLSAFLVMFLGLNFMNVNRLVAHVNVARYTSGVAASVDFDTLESLGNAAVPEVLPLLQDHDALTAGKARELLKTRAESIGGSWQTFTAERFQVANALQSAGFQIGAGSIPEK